MKPRILVVDDEDQIRRMLKRLFARRFPDADVTEAASGEAALKLLETERFDLVLTDFRMDGVTGADVLRHIERESPDTARVLATGYQDDASVDDALVGVTLHGRLAKPWENERLVALVEDLLKARA